MAKRIGWYGLLLILTIGCDADPVKPAPVQGRIFFHNEPLRGGTIVFTPDAERGTQGPMATAEIQSDGRYTLRTGTEPGAVPGWHRVTVAAGSDSKTLPRTYSDPKRSGLSREVKAGQANAFDFYLE